MLLVDKVDEGGQTKEPRDSGNFVYSRASL